MERPVKLPVMVQPGQTPGTIGIPLGYGRTKAGKVADGIGAKCIPYRCNGEWFIELFDQQRRICHHR